MRFMTGEGGMIGIDSSREIPFERFGERGGFHFCPSVHLGERREGGRDYIEAFCVGGLHGAFVQLACSVFVAPARDLTKIIILLCISEQAASLTISHYRPLSRVA